VREELQEVVRSSSLREFEEKSAIVEATVVLGKSSVFSHALVRLSLQVELVFNVGVAELRSSNALLGSVERDANDETLSAHAYRPKLTSGTFENDPLRAIPRLRKVRQIGELGQVGAARATYLANLLEQSITLDSDISHSETAKRKRESEVVEVRQETAALISLLSGRLAPLLGAAPSPLCLRWERRNMY
jgi:hypothetical protein